MFLEIQRLFLKVSLLSNHTKSQVRISVSISSTNFFNSSFRSYGFVIFTEIIVNFRFEAVAVKICLMIVLHYAISVLGLLPPRNIAPNPQNNPMPNPNPNRAAIFLGGNWLPSNPDPSLNTNLGVIFHGGGGNCTDTCSFIGCLTYLSIFYFNLGVNMTNKKNKIKNINKPIQHCIKMKLSLH